MSDSFEAKSDSFTPDPPQVQAQQQAQGFHPADMLMNMAKQAVMGATAPVRAVMSAANPNSQMVQNAAAGFLQTPGYQPTSGVANQAAYLAGKYGPTAAGATIGSMLPGAGTAVGAALTAGVGAAMGKSLQNLGQTVSNQITPGSAAQKSPSQLVAEPTTDAIVQGLFAGGTQAAANAIKGPVAQYVSGMTGVKQNLVERTLGNLREVFNSPSVKDAGNAIGDIANQAGIKTGTDGLKQASATLLGKDAATDEFSTATTLAMAKIARDAPEALTPQEMYSTAEGLRKAMAAPKYADPHGAFSQNYRMYAGQLADLENRLEQAIPGYSEARSGYANALAKEAFSNFSPLNKNMSSSQLKLMSATPQALLGAAGAYQGYKGNSGPAELLLSAALLSPYLVGSGIRAGAAALQSGLPQAGLAAASQPASNALANTLGGQQ